MTRGTARYAAPLTPKINVGIYGIHGVSGKDLTLQNQINHLNNGPGHNLEKLKKADCPHERPNTWFTLDILALALGVQCCDPHGLVLLG